MKNRKFVLLAFLLIATIVVGVGYAAITSSLSLVGTNMVKKSDDNLKVVFTGVEVSNEEGYITAVTASIANGDYPTTATFQTENFKKEGDKAKAVFTIENKSNGLDATIADANAVVTVKKVADGATLDADEYFKITVVHAEHELAVGDTTTLTVTIELLKTPTDDISIEYTVTNVVTAVE